ncbi:MAG: hypothetical protein MOB07_16350 [Acidobacteria bacterium]|nr:hypothetical protein [Acidobacteriota bacterium]
MGSDRTVSAASNPAKETDSRFTAYQEQFGDESWELDALEPTVLLAIIQAAIDQVKDSDLYDEIKDREESQREILNKASERWSDVASFLNGFETCREGKRRTCRGLRQ